MQTKTQSFIESFTNVAVGIAVAFVSQLIVFPLVGVDSTIKQNAYISIYFTIISLIRSYILRRYFNKVTKNELT